MKRLLSVVLILTVLLLVSSVSATENATITGDGSGDVYVDDVNGNDFNDGATNATSFKSIEKAVSASANDSTIYLNDGTYSGSKNTKITIDKSLTIQGCQNTIIDGENANYLFTVTDGVKVTFKNIKFINAYKSPESYAINYPDPVYGSAIEIKNAEVIIDSCIFEGNQLAYSTNNQYTYGGAISNNGDLTITDSTFISNIAHSTSGLFSYGGAIYNEGRLNVTGSSFLESESDDFAYGGFIANNGDLIITDSVIANAKSAGESRGSAIYNTGNMRMYDSVVENNSISKANFQYIYGAIYNSGNFMAQSNIFRNNTGAYSVPSRGSPTIYSVGDLNLSYNLFLSNHPYDGVYKDVYLNSAGDINLDNNWWGSNDDPYLTGSFNIRDQIKTWLVLNVTPDYIPLSIGETADIMLKWDSNLNLNIDKNLIPKSDIKISNRTYDFNNLLTYEFTDTQTKGLKSLIVNYYNFTKIVEIDVGKITTGLNVDYNANISYLDDLKINLTVTSPSGIPDGIVIINVGEKKYNVTLENGCANYTISGLNPGSYDLKVSYNGSENYFKSFNTSRLTINKRMVYIDFEIPEVYVDENARATIRLSPEGSKSTAVITYNGKNKRVYLYDDRVNEISLGYLDAGEYNVTLTYYETDYFMADSVTKVLKVNRRSSLINITAPDIMLGEIQTVQIRVSPADIRGYALLSINNNNYEIYLDGEITNITIPNLQAGKYNLRLTYPGDDRYTPATANASFNVLKAPSKLEVTVNYDDNTLKGNILVRTNARNCTGVVDVYINYNVYHMDLTNGQANFPVAYDKGTNYIYVYYGGDDYWAEADWNTTIGVADEFIFMSGDVEGYEYNDFNYSVRLIEVNGVPLPSRVITFNFQNQLFNATTDSNGYAYFSLNLPTGKYSISASYKNQTVTNNVTVRGIDFSITASNSTYGGNATFRATLNANVTGRFNFTINDTLSFTVDIVDGVAEFSTANLDAGNYTLCGFYFNDRFASHAKSAGFEVRKADSKLDWIVDNVISGEDANITVYLTNTATGNITFILDGIEQIKGIRNDKAYITVLNISGASHSIRIIYSGDGNFNANSINSTFYIKDLRTDVLIDVSNITYGEEFTATAYLDINATGNVTFSINGTVRNVNVENGKAVLKLANLNAGDYVLSATYNGNTFYITSSNATGFSVLKANSTIRIECDAYIDENVLIYAYLSKGATGYVSFSMPGYYTSRDKVIDDSIALWYISPLTTGVYTVNARYPGDNNYYASNASHVINISQVKAKLKVNINDVTVNERVIINVALTAGGEGLNGSVAVKLNSRTYTLNVKNGRGSLVIGRMAQGVYDYEATYEGDGVYTRQTVTGSFRVDERLHVILESRDVTKYYGGAQRLEVTVKDSSSNPLSNMNVLVSLNAKSYNLTTDDEGKAFIDLNFEAGNYTAKIMFPETEKYYAESANATVTIKTTVQGIDVTKQVGTSSEYFAIFLDSNGRALANTKVKYVIGDRTFTATTFVNGISRVNINLNPGFYLIYAVNPVTGETAVNSLFIYNRLMENADLTQSYSQGKYYKVRAYTSSGSIAGAGQNVVFKVAGKTYNIKTDAKGYASLKVDLKPGTYAITASYGGVTVKNKIAVKSIVVAKNVKVKRTAKMLKVKVSLKKVNGKYLKGKKITLKFKGKTYKAKTNKKGVATFKIKKNVIKKLKKGKKYKYTVTYLKDSVKKSLKVK